MHETIRACPSCGGENAAEARFCNQCATPLAGQAAAPATPVEAERKQVSVLFADLTGFTALSERLDPEETREILGRIFRSAADVVARYDGRIEKFVGDAIMALFGVPHAHEDDPVRAVRAALELHQAVDALAPEVEASTGARIALHSGVNTGLVVTGELHIDRGTAGPLGDTINLAARLMGLAPAGEIWVGPETRHLAAAAFAFEDLGELEIKGKVEPVAAARVRRIAAGPASDTAPRRHARFVGRQEELGILLGAVERLRDGEGSAVEISGEAGTGKTRLVEELHARAGDDVQWLEGKAYLYAEKTPYSPLIDLLNRAFGIVEGDARQTVREKLEAGVAALDADATLVLPAFARLYDLELAEAPRIDRETWQERLGDALRALIAAASARAPTVVCVQDLHWADRSTTRLLRGLVREPGAPVLFVCNHRPGFRLGEGARELELGELSGRQTRALLASLLADDEPPAELVHFVERRSDGNPFYVEELVQSLVETEVLAHRETGWTLTRPLAETEVPPSIRGLIAGRIDRLDDTKKRVLREAAVVGREFLYEVIAQVSVGSDLDPSLAGLEAADLIRTKSREPDLEYIFRHALTQEVAYDGLLRSERRKLHERTAYAVERLATGRPNEFVETLARHFLRGGVVEKAVHYLTLSGRKCIERYALDDAAAHFQEAYALLRERDRTPAEDRALIELLNEWALVHYYLGTFPELRQQLDAHLEVAVRVGDPELEGFCRGWLGLALYFLDELEASLEALDRAVVLGERADSPRLIAYANAWRAFTLSQLLRLPEAIEAGEKAQALAARFPEDHYLHFKSLAAVGWAVSATGDLPRAVEVAERLLVFAEKTGNARAAVAGYQGLAVRHLMAREYDLAIEAGQAACARGRDPFYGEWGVVWMALAGMLGLRFEVSRTATDRLLAFSEGRCLLWSRIARFSDSGTQLGEGRLSAGMARLLAEHVDAARGEDAYATTFSYPAIGMLYAQICRREAPASLGAVLRNPGFVLRHVLPARRKALAWLRRSLEEMERTGMLFCEGSVHLELALLLAERDRAQARGHLDQALAILERQDAQRELARARELDATLATA